MTLTLLLLILLIAPLARPFLAEPCQGARLTEVALEVGLVFTHDRGGTGAKHEPETLGSGLAWLDFDGDGWLDLYVVQSGPFPPDGSAGAANRLFRNRRDGTFEDVTEIAGVGDRGYGQGVVAVDINGDGHQDIYVCNFGPDVLYLNRGDGRFENATSRAGLGLDGWSSSAAFADADGDGDLDLYVARYLVYDWSDAEKLFCGDPKTGLRDYCHPQLFRGATDRFYLNRGDGTFEDATERAGLSDADGKGLGVVMTDLDGDVFPDIYVANDTTINLLFRNRGDGTYEDLSFLSGAGFNRDGQAEAGMGIAVGDVDGDGDPDIAVTNLDTETNTLYRNLGDMLFEDVSGESGFGLPSFNKLGFGIALTDLDRDGNLDFYVANGHVLEHPTRGGVTHAQPDLLLLGDGEGHFREQLCGAALEQAEVGRGVAVADYDNDGDVDVAILNSGGRLRLLRNDSGDRPWVGFRLRGGPPNTEGIGARVTLKTSTSRQVRWVLAGESYQSSSDRRQVFSVREGDPPEAVEVDWPSGKHTALPLDTAMHGRYVEIWELERLPPE